MARGERPIKAGNSWFSAKSIEVERHVDAAGGRALDGLGGREPYQTQPNSEYLEVMCGRHTVGANVHCGEGNNPDQQLRPQIRG